MSRIVARFKKERHGDGTEIDANELPAEWTHPRAERGESWDGAQVLGLHRAMEMIDDGEDVRDDWFRGGKGYDALQLLVVDGKSGDSGPLSYPAVTEEDVKALHTINLDDLEWALTEIAIALDEEGEPVEFDAMGFAEDRWWDGLVNEVIDRLINRSEAQNFDAAEIDWRSLGDI